MSAVLTTKYIKENTGLKVKFETLDELYTLSDFLVANLPPRPKPAAAPKAKEVKKATKAAPPPPSSTAEEADLLAPVDDAAPAPARTAALGATDSLRGNAYRIQSLTADHCYARKIDEDNVIAGTRPGDAGAKGKVFPEKQCTRKPVAGTHLCTMCAKKEAEYLADTSKVPKGWYGRLDQELFHKAYVVGCEWFWANYPEGIEGARGPTGPAKDSAAPASEKPKKAPKKPKEPEAPAAAEVEAESEAPAALAAAPAEKPKKAPKKPKDAPAPPAAEAEPEAEAPAAPAEKPKKAPKKPKAEPAPAPPTEEEGAEPEAEVPAAKPKKATVAANTSASTVEWVTFLSDGIPLIRHTKTGNCYQCDRSKHRLEEMVMRDKFEGKWRDGRLDPYAEEDEE